MQIKFKLEPRQINSFLDLIVAEMRYKKIDSNTVEFYYKGNKKLTKQYAHTIKIFKDCFEIFDHSLDAEEIVEIRNIIIDAFGKFLDFKSLNESLAIIGVEFQPYTTLRLEY